MEKSKYKITTSELVRRTAIYEVEGENFDDAINNFNLGEYDFISDDGFITEEIEILNVVEI